MKKKYVHLEKQHNLISPRLLVPIFMETGQYSSVIDVGCGVGTFLNVFYQHGVTDLCGVDGAWVDKKLLKKYIPKIEMFKEIDLEKPIRINRKFDLAISLEVAEHLSPGRAESFVDDLCFLSDNIIFSAAIPYQGGKNHINEKLHTYWIKLFNERGYSCSDVIRPKVWNNSDVQWWYKQNIFFFKKTDIIKNYPDIILDYVHPELLKVAFDYKEENSVKRHLKLLIKALMYKINGK